MANSKTKNSSKSSKNKTNKRFIQNGAHKSSSNMPKVLRVGIIQQSKIIEERIIRKRDNVYVGQSVKNDFILPPEDAPLNKFCLFETKGQGAPYILNFTKDMKGKLSLKDSVVELSDAIKQKMAQQKGKYYQLELSSDSRGKVVLGNTTILFQFVSPPLVQPRPQLPAAVKGSPFQDLELVISLTMIVSFAFHLGVILFFNLNDWPEKTLEEKYKDLQALLNTDTASFDKKVKEDDNKADKGKGDEEFEEEEEKKPAEVKHKAPAKAEPAEDTGPKKSAEQVAKERADRRAALAQQIAQQGINKILGSIGGSGAGAVADVLSGGDVAADQDDLLKQVSGIGVANGEGRSKLKGPAGGKGSGEAADLSQVRAQGGDKNVKTSGPGPEKAIKGRVRKKAPTASGGTGMMSSSDVARVVSKRLGAIKGCYERGLKRNPGLKGKITIRFTISGSGRVSTARATLNELTPDVASCITGAFKRFRFPPPEGGEVTFEYPFLFSPAN